MACPENQSCVSGTCVIPGAASVPPDASPDAPPGAVDTDRDSIPDDRDNCPMLANLDQANEDGDKFGDVCDLCPQISDNGADSDGDKIGDACDPNPGAADTVWLFNGFSAGLPAWSRSDHWTGAGGNVVATSGNGTNDGEYLVTPFTTAATPDNFSVTMSVTVQTLSGSTSGDHSVGIEIWDSSAMKGVDCALDQEPAAQNSLLYLADDFKNLGKSVAVTWTPGTQYLITLARHGAAYTCTVTGPGLAQPATLSGNSNVVPRDGNAIDIWAYGTTAQYGSVFIAGRP